jgi:hypothetical protein
MSVNFQSPQTVQHSDSNPAISAGAHLCGLGLSAASGAIAAVALSNPLGAAGGAIAGLGVSLFSGTIGKMCDEVTGADNKTAGTIRKTIAAVASFFASAGALMGISSAAGYTMSFGAACAFTATTAGIGAGIALGICLTALLVSLVASCIMRYRDSRDQRAFV